MYGREFHRFSVEHGVYCVPVDEVSPFSVFAMCHKSQIFADILSRTKKSDWSKAMISSMPFLKVDLSFLKITNPKMYSTAAAEGGSGLMQSKKNLVPMSVIAFLSTPICYGRFETGRPGRILDLGPPSTVWQSRSPLRYSSCLRATNSQL